MRCLIKNANEAPYNYTLTDMELDKALRVCPSVVMRVGCVVVG